MRLGRKSSKSSVHSDDPQVGVLCQVAAGFQQDTTASPKDKVENPLARIAVPVFIRNCLGHPVGG